MTETTETDPIELPDETTDELLPPAPADRDWPRHWMSPFLRALQSIPEVSDACILARVSRATVYRYRAALPDFADAWDEALSISHRQVERTVQRWISEGGIPTRTVRTVTRTKTDADGRKTETTVEEIVSESSERSAQLAMFWLRAWKPERYRPERVQVEGTGVDGSIRVESVESIDAQIAKLSAELAAQAGAEPVPTE